MRDVIIALDFKSADEALKFLDKFDEQLFVKIGMELYYAAGPSVVSEIKKRGHKIFLDLKLHDIPNTVYSAINSVKCLGVNMVDVHIAGGRDMISAARRALDEGDNRPLLLGITMLTSTSQEVMNEDILIPGNVAETVVSYVKTGKANGIDAIVCSALEVPEIKKAVDDIITITPGIRPADESGKDDQKRVVTPAMARELGSDYIVVGRPITKSENPVEAYRRIKKEFLGD